MKILQIDYSLAAGGAERLIVDLCNEMSKDHEVTLLTITDFKIANNNFYLYDLSSKVKNINLGKKKGNNIQTFINIFSVIHKIKPDIIHAHLNTIIYLFLPSIIFRKKIKFFHTLHSTAETASGYFFQEVINTFFYKRKYIQPITISTHSKKSFFNHYKFDNSILITNGRKQLEKTELFNQTKIEISNLKIHEDDIVFTHIARFEAAKNQEMLIAVFNKLLKENFHIILLIIGDHFNTSKAQFLKKNNYTGIYFLGTKNNISDYLYNSHAFCLSSSREGLPISLIEALSCGVVPICTPAGGIINIIDDEINGYLSSDLSAESYYNAIIKYLANQNSIPRDRLQIFFKENLSIKECADKHINAYKSL